MSDVAPELSHMSDTEPIESTVTNTHRVGEKVETETQHRWFAYGRWFSGYGSSMDPHYCGDPDEPCQTRQRVIRTIEDPWTEWQDRV